MKISIIGTGYVGLVSGVCFAEKGNDVTCVDIDKDKIEKLKKGVLPIYETGLETLFQRNVIEKRLHFSTSLSDGIENSQVIFLALPTPPGDDGSADLSYVLKASEDIAKLLKEYTVIVTKSTVPVGTSKRVKKIIAKYTKTKFDVVSNPEFLREGFAVSDFMKPDRVVVGSSSEQALSIIRELYEPYVRQGNPIIEMNEESAEITKYAANSLLATRISFMNSIANLCQKVGANVDSVRLGIGADYRIGKYFLYPGIGYGGSCFPKDVKALIKTASEYGEQFNILEAVEQTNQNQRKILANKVIDHYHGNVSGKRFALWGLSFKPDTDDMREAPSIDIINTLTAAGAEIVAYDPVAIDNAKRILTKNKNLKFKTDAMSTLKDADALLIATEWSEFQNPDFAKVKNELKSSIIFDGRNIFKLSKMKKEGIHYESIGRPIVK